MPLEADWRPPTSAPASMRRTCENAPVRCRCSAHDSPTKPPPTTTARERAAERVAPSRNGGGGARRPRRGEARRGSTDGGAARRRGGVSGARKTWRDDVETTERTAPARVLKPTSDPETDSRVRSGARAGGRTVTLLEKEKPPANPPALAPRSGSWRARCPSRLAPPRRSRRSAAPWRRASSAASPPRLARRVVVRLGARARLDRPARRPRPRRAVVRAARPRSPTRPPPPPARSARPPSRTPPPRTRRRRRAATPSASSRSASG